MYLLALIIILSTFRENESSESKTLKMVNLVYRHGARSPIQFYPNDKYQEQDWPDGAGRLTQKGMNLEYNLGMFLKERYIVNTSFINRQYVHKEVYIRSSDSERCLQSAETQLAGFYPPQGYQIWNTRIPWQPVPIHSVPKDEDPVLRPDKGYCPRLQELWKKKKQYPIYKTKLANYGILFDELSNYTGMHVTGDNLWIITDATICEKAEGLDLPKWMDTRWNEMNELSNWIFGYSYHGGDELGRLLGGPLLREITNNMENMRQNTSQLYKMNIFSGHDTSLLALSAGLDIEINIPIFASCIMIELVYSTKTGYMVEMFYRNDYTGNLYPLKLKSCDISCPLDKFVTLTHGRVSRNRDKECGVHDGFFTMYLLKVLLGIFFVMTTLLASVVVCICARRKSLLVNRFWKEEDIGTKDETKGLTSVKS